MASEQIETQLKRVPTASGVYLFRNAAGEVLYVGKAKTLRPRVRSYFQAGSSDTRQGIRAMANRVETIETIVTSSEVEALHLEQNLVKRHRPPFNVRLRDDKSFPYIAVTVEDEYPRVMFTRERHRRGVWYFGPYANAKKVRETLDVLNRVFRYRPCEGPQPGRHSGIPCLDFHIERCHAPCVGYISKEDYRELIDQVIEFLSGDDRPIRRRLEQQMREAAAEERFEDAARYRNRLRAIERLSERQAVERPSVGTIDVIGDRGLARARGGAGLPAARRAHGRPVLVPPRERRAARSSTRCSSSSASSTTASAPSIPPQILVPRGAGDTTALEAVPRRSGAARASRCARQSAARSGGCRSSRSRTRGSRSTPRRSSPRRSARAASRRSRSCARRSTSSRCRSGSSASTSRTSRARRSSGRWSSSRTRSRRRRTTASSRCGRSTARTTSPRCAR